MLNKSGIYKIINIVNEKCYIGSAVNFKQRWMDHKKLLNKNKHHSKHLQNTWNKYSKDNFKFEILLTCEKEELLDYEQLHFDELKPEYNICKIAGSSLGIKHTEETLKKLRNPKSEETKAKLKEAWKTRPPISEETREKHRLNMIGRDLGKIYSEEQRVKLRKPKSEQGRENIRKAAKTRKPATEEAKANMSKGHIGKIPSTEARLNMSIAQTGRFVSEETRRKISEGNKGKEVSAKTREKHRINSTGRLHTEESKAKMSVAQTGHNCTEERKANISKSLVGKKKKPWTDERKAERRVLLAFLKAENIKVGDLK